MSVNSYDRATMSLQCRVDEFGVDTVFTRFLASQPECKTGALRKCCNYCSMGPCRITEKNDTTICGVDKHTIVMWNYARNVAGGVSQHAWHAYYYLSFLQKALRGETQFELAGVQIGRQIAAALGIEESDDATALQRLVSLFSDELTGSLQGKGESKVLEYLVPSALLNLWREVDVLPLSPMVEVVRTITRTSLGVESDPKQLALQTIKVGISDLVNEFVAVSAHNIIHGGFKLVQSEANLGAMEVDKVNILLHGHIPVMPSVIAQLADDPELLAYAREKGAAGINPLGVCCSGNELLARYGVPLVGNFSQQELFIMTGAVDGFVVEQQCVLPTLVKVAKNFHTKVFSTDKLASVPGSERMPVEFDRAYDQGREIIRACIDNFQNRNPNDIEIPAAKHGVDGAFSLEIFEQVVGLDNLVEAIARGNVSGIVAMAACNNPRIKHNFGIVGVARELLKNDVLLVATGCAAPGLASEGLMSRKYLANPTVGAGIRAFCEDRGIPPVLMFGSCISNSHIFLIAKQVAAKIGCQITDLPIAASAPEWMNEKLFPIATYLLTAGIMVHIGPPPPVMGSELVISVFTNDVKEIFGGELYIEPTPSTAGDHIAKYLKRKRTDLLAKSGGR